MHAKRLVTLLCAAAVSGALMAPALASAGDWHDHRDHSRYDRWEAQAPRDRDWHRHAYRDRHHHKRDKWSRHHHRHDDAVRVYVEHPRRPPPPFPPAAKLRLGRDLTLILR